jgi:cbb3-type cytochrome oxidase maturation protein
MEVLIVTVFASLLLVATALVFFAWNLKQRSHEHIDRLTLLPLADDEQTVHGQSETKE